MEPDTALAFDRLEARADALAQDAPRDRISLRDHVVEVEIGAFQVERGIRQRVSFDVVVEVVPRHADVADDVDRIMSYDAIAQAISGALSAQRMNLLETLAERICARLLREPQAARVFVRIQKLDRGPGALGVEIIRSAAPSGAVAHSGTTTHSGAVAHSDAPENSDASARSDAAAYGDPDPAPRPLVAFFSNAAVGSPDLNGWMTQLTDTGAPLVICLDFPPVTPKAEGADAQRHIDLLSLEQAAWAFSALWPQGVVVGTKTELEWGMRQGQVSIWAPSQMVLDALEPPEMPDAASLAVWFAGQVNARELLCIGAAVPAGCPVPARAVPLDKPRTL